MLTLLDINWWEVCCGWVFIAVGIVGTTVMLFIYKRRRKK